MLIHTGANIFSVLRQSPYGEGYWGKSITTHQYQSGGINKIVLSLMKLIECGGDMLLGLLGLQAAVKFTKPSTERGRGATRLVMKEAKHISFILEAFAKAPTVERLSSPARQAAHFDGRLQSPNPYDL